jgi:hypothetical protein
MAFLNIILSVIYILASVLKFSDAANAYLYYENASCSSGGNVTGELYYVWDDKNMKGKGRHIQNYKGSCKYFENGVFNTEFETTESGYMRDGYCIVCKGMLGCTSKKYYCQYFQTIIPSKQTYKLSYNSTKTVSEESEVNDDQYTADLEEVAENIYQEILSSNMYKSTPQYVYSLAGAAVAFTTFFATIAASRKYNRRIVLNRSIDPSSLTEEGGVQV